MDAPVQSRGTGNRGVTGLRPEPRVQSALPKSHKSGLPRKRKPRVAIRRGIAALS